MTLLTDIDLLRSSSYINGDWEPEHPLTLAVHNPANNRLLTEVSMADAAACQRAIDAANQAQSSWQATPAKTRSQLLRKWLDLIVANRQDLAQLLTAEQGKPLAEALAEVDYGADFVEWFAEEAKRIYGDVLNLPERDRRGLVLRRPVGVVAAITPWNFPNAMITRKVAPALAAGCSVILKPAESTPLSALALAELAARAGIPPGVFNVIVGDPIMIGETLTSSTKIQKLTFTGSTRVGKILLRQCADTVKRTSMELGGNAPMIVFDDADLEVAVKATMASKFRNSGQTCVCTNRLLVHADICDEFVAKLQQQMAQITLGDGSEAGTTQGPLIDQQAAQGVAQKVDQAVQQGAKIVTGGKNDTLGECYYPPTLLTEVTEKMAIFDQEIFGPVLPVITFTSEAEAIALANNTRYGLAAYFITQDQSRAWRVAEALDYGMTAVNEGAISSEMMPFGGVKESGHGREGSKYGLDDYTELKYVCMGGIQPLN